MKLLIIFISLFSSQTFAKNKVQFLLEEKFDTSAFEILAQFHNKGDGQPVGLDELNSVDLDSHSIENKYDHCAKVNNNQTDKILDTDFYIFKKTKIIPGTPPKGPLFPGTPDIILQRSSLSLDLHDISSPYSSDLSEILDNSQWKDDLLGGTIFNQLSDRQLNDFEDYNYGEVRKHNDLISFFVASRRNGYQRYSAYGYCWNE